MKGFLSWSGQRSRYAALALTDWISDVLQEVETWVSHDIGAGQRWSREIDEQLSMTDFGVLCLTRENLQEPWILFEAGALAKRVRDDARVVPYLVDNIEFQDLEPPLGLFQAKKANRSGTQELIWAMNTLLQAPLNLDRLDRVFETAWPRLEEVLRGIPVSETEPYSRGTDDILSEVLETVRSISKRVDYVSVLLPDVPERYSDRTWKQIVAVLKRESPAIAAVYEEAKCERFTSDELVLEFPTDLGIYKKLAGEQKRQNQLLEVIESLHGIRPNLRLEVK